MKAFTALCLLAMTVCGELNWGASSDGAACCCC